MYVIIFFAKTTLFIHIRIIIDLNNTVHQHWPLYPSAIIKQCSLHTCDDIYLSLSKLFTSFSSLLMALAASINKTGIARAMIAVKS
jgi:hypothetical protein